MRTPAPKKTHCPAGHEYTPENTLIYRNWRSCRKCKRDWKEMRCVGVDRRKKSHCTKGHPYNEENTGFLESGKKYCKVCARARSRGRSKEVIATLGRAWRAVNPDKVRHGNARSQLHKYGLKFGDYDRMLSEQGGVCAICKKPSPTVRRLHVDHCHETNNIRALLCHHCNVGLGHFKDDINLLNEAQIYLWKHKNKEKTA